MLAVARVAGITAIKNTGTIIPLAHGGVGIEGARVRVEVVDGREGEGGNADADALAPPPPPPPTKDDETPTTTSDVEKAQNITTPIHSHGGIRISALVETTGKTGVEMEALCGVAGAGLTVIDMVKSVDKGCVLEEVKVVGKKGGSSGAWGVWG